MTPTITCFLLLTLAAFTSARPETFIQDGPVDKKAGAAVMPPTKLFSNIDLTSSSATGIITSANFPQNYPHNTDASWVLSIPFTGAKIHLRFTDFSTEEDYDTVTVYDGASTNDRIVGNYSGSSLPPAVYSTGNQLLVRFKTDERITNTGFRASYAGNIQDGVVNNAGIIESPHHPHNYPSNIAYIWRLHARSEAAKVQLHFDLFDTESGSDVLEVRDGSLESSTLLGRYSGLNGGPDTVESTGQDLFLKFKTDNSVTRTGFSAEFVSAYSLTDAAGFFADFSSATSGPIINEYVIQPESPIPGVVALRFNAFDLDGDTQTIEIRDGPHRDSPLIAQVTGAVRPQAIYSTGPALFLRFTSSAQAPAAKGFEVSYSTGSKTHHTAAHGHFTSLNFPLNYPSAHLAQYVVTVPGDHQRVRLAFESFVTESDFDWVEIYDGAHPSSPLLAQLSGTKPQSSESYTSTSNVMSLVFRADDTVSKQGFFAVYQSVPASCSPDIITYLDGSAFTYDELHPKE